MLKPGHVGLNTGEGDGPAVPVSVIHMHYLIGTPQGIRHAVGLHRARSVYRRAGGLIVVIAAALPEVLPDQKPDNHHEQQQPGENKEVAAHL